MRKYKSGVKQAQITSVFSMAQQMVTPGAQKRGCKHVHEELEAVVQRGTFTEGGWLLPTGYATSPGWYTD